MPLKKSEDLWRRRVLSETPDAIQRLVTEEGNVDKPEGGAGPVRAET